MQMIEYGPAHGVKWTQSIIVLTSNVGSDLALRISQDRARVRYAATISAMTSRIRVASHNDAMPVQSRSEQPHGGMPGH